LAAGTLTEVLATSDVPGGVSNLLTGHKSELVPVLAAHVDVDAIDTWGVAADAQTEVESSAADSVKRLARRPRGVVDERFDWADDRAAQRPEWIAAFLEMKTVWPIGADAASQQVIEPTVVERRTYIRPIPGSSGRRSTIRRPRTPSTRSCDSGRPHQLAAAGATRSARLRSGSCGRASGSRPQARPESRFGPCSSATASRLERGWTLEPGAGGGLGGRPGGPRDRRSLGGVPRLARPWVERDDGRTHLRILKEMAEGGGR
jgi:hypothetical protein